MLRRFAPRKDGQKDFLRDHQERFPDVDIPRTYILGLKDKSIPPELARAYAKRLRVTPAEIDAGHDLMVSKPEEVAAAMTGIA